MFRDASLGAKRLFSVMLLRLWPLLRLLTADVLRLGLHDIPVAKFSLTL